MTTGRGSSRAWQWRNAFAESDLDATTKAVLGDLFCFMNAAGRKCFPPQGLIARRCSLTEKTVRKHLKVAELAGWIVVQEGRFTGKKNRLSSYEARWPHEVIGGDVNRETMTEGPVNDGR